MKSSSKLRRYRNKVHIQDDIEGVSRDEESVFTDEICVWASRLTLRVTKYLSEHLSRPQELHHYVSPLLMPSL